MLLRGRQFFARVGRYEVFAEDWKREAGEPLVLSMRGGSDVQEWVPELHLIVSRKV
ncbi:MAG: hypothetical protein H6R16_436 [Proteobacteria bacterium]|nr:hypothetical protein [Pseudomonadota bacterium]